MMNQVASQTEIGKICSKPSPCSASRLSRPADTPSAALSHGQEVKRTSEREKATKCHLQTLVALSQLAARINALNISGSPPR